MDYMLPPLPYAKPRKEFKIINSSEYELNLGEEPFSLLIGINSNDMICFKLKNKQNLLLYDYTKEFSYEQISELLRFDRGQYGDLSKIMKFFSLSIEKKRLTLLYNEENKKIILNVTRSSDFEEFQIPIELNEKKLTNEEMFQLLFDEINAIKNNSSKKKEEENEEKENKEMINNLMNKNKENEEYIKNLENKIIKLENIINDFKNNISKKTSEKININDFNNFKNNINKIIEEQNKSISSLKINIEQKINDISNSLNNFIIDFNGKIKENVISMNNLKSNIEDKLEENKKEIFNNLQKNFLYSFNKTMDKPDMPNIFNMNNINNDMNNLNINNMNKNNNMNQMNNINNQMNNMNQMNNINNQMNNMNNNMNQMNNINNQMNQMNNMNQMKNMNPRSNMNPKSNMNPINNNNFNFFNQINMNNNNNNNINPLLNSMNQLNFGNQMNNFQINNMKPTMMINFKECFNTNSNTIVVNCFLDEKIGNAIKRYKKQSCYKGQNHRYYFDSKQITNMELTIPQIGITNENNNIYVN